MISAASPHLIARDLRRSFRVGGTKIDVLRGIDVDIYPGEAVFLCGASGAGKTTLLYTLAGLERPESGTVEFEGRQLYRGSETSLAKLRNSRVGFVFQGYFLLPELTALENVTLPSMIGGKPRPDDAKAALEQVGLGQRMQHLPSELSGGEQQRVAIARAIVGNATAILADEPTGALDSENGHTVMTILAQIAKDPSRAVLVVTHDPRIIPFADRVIHIEDGRILSEERNPAGRIQSIRPAKLASNRG